jgi:hypothetical protein
MDGRGSFYRSIAVMTIFSLANSALGITTSANIKRFCILSVSYLSGTEEASEAMATSNTQGLRPRKVHQPVLHQAALIML